MIIYFDVDKCYQEDIKREKINLKLSETSKSIKIGENDILYVVIRFQQGHDYFH